MSTNNSLAAIFRPEVGTNKVEGTRKEGRIPAVIYGMNQDSAPISVDHKDFARKIEDPNFYSRVITIDVGEKKEQVILKAVDRHPYKNQIRHIDFLRVDLSKHVKIKVRINLINKVSSPVIKSGGVLQNYMNELEFFCLPGSMPTEITIDLAEIKEDIVLNVNDLKLPEKSYLPKSVSAKNSPVFKINTKREDS